MMNTMTYTPPITAVSELTQVSALMATTPFRKWDRERGREKEQKQKKKPTGFEKLLETECERMPGQVGCFFEAKA